MKAERQGADHNWFRARCSTALLLTAAGLVLFASTALGQSDRQVRDEAAGELCKAIDIAINRLAPQLSSAFVRSDSRIVGRRIESGYTFFTYVDTKLTGIIWEAHGQGIVQFLEVELSGDAILDIYRSEKYLNDIADKPVPAGFSGDVMMWCGGSTHVLLSYVEGRMSRIGVDYSDND